MSGDTYTQGHFIRDRAAAGLERLAYRVRTMADTQGDPAGQIARYRNGAAARLDSLATYVREADLPTVLRDAGQFSRRRPEVLVVGGFLTGFLVARFLGPSRRRADNPWRSAAGRWHEALQKGAHVVASAADTLKETAQTRGFSPETVAEKVGKHLALVGDRIVGGSMKRELEMSGLHQAKRAVKKVLRKTA